MADTVLVDDDFKYGAVDTLSDLGTERLVAW